MKLKSILTMVGLTGIVAYSISGCSSGSNSSSSGVSIVNGTAGSYQGAGSKWKVDFTTTNFTLNHYPSVSAGTANLSVSGTYIEYSTGFRKMTVTSATGAGAPANGVQAYGFDVPGFAFFLKPIESNSEPIVMLKAGSCPSSGFTGNWMIAKFDDNVVLDNTKDTFGSAVFTNNGTASTAVIGQLEAQGGTLLGYGTMSYNYNTCTDAALSFAGSNDTVDMFFTENGGALVHSYGTVGSGHDNLIFAGPRHTSAITQADLAGTYSALVFDESSLSDKIFPGKLVIPSSGDGNAYQITDVETDALSSESLTISNITANSHANGLFNATINSGSETGRVSCMYFVSSNKKVIACNGYGNTSNRKPFFFLARAR